MIETDCPFLSPEPVRKVRPNEPAFVAHTARFLAELRGQALEAFAAQTTANAVRFFGLPEAQA
jgi:TatD DNase family protein